MNLLERIEKEGLKNDVTPFREGDTVRVYFKIVEGNKERVQAFEGLVIARKNTSVRETFTVRKISFGIGVERTFPVHSPRIEKIEVVRKGDVRRAKLYYIRNLTGKAATRVKEKKRIDIKVVSKSKAVSADIVETKTKTKAQTQPEITENPKAE